MRVTKILAIVAVAMLAVPPLHAATMSTFSSGKTNVESSVIYTAGKKKKVATYKPCGAFMYRKDGKCVDARAKK